MASLSNLVALFLDRFLDILCRIYPGFRKRTSPSRILTLLIVRGCLLPIRVCLIFLKIHCSRSTSFREALLSRIRGSIKDRLHRWNSLYPKGYVLRSCIAADIPRHSFPVTQPEPEHFILMSKKLDLLKELPFGRSSSSWWYACYSECEMMKKADVPVVPIYAAILDALKNLWWKPRGIDNAQALCRAASAERKASN